MASVASDNEAEGHGEPLAAVLEGFGHWGERVDAAVALRALPITPRSVAALHRGMFDQEPLVADELLGVYTTRPDRAPGYPNLRTTLEHLGFADLPESVTLDEDATAATLDAVTTALDFDLDVSRWCATDLLIGDRSRLALEIDRPTRTGHNCAPARCGWTAPSPHHSTTRRTCRSSQTRCG